MHTIAKGHTKDNLSPNQCCHYPVSRDHDVNKRRIFKTPPIHNNCTITVLFYVNTEQSKTYLVLRPASVHEPVGGRGGASPSLYGHK